MSKSIAVSAALAVLTTAAPGAYAVGLAIGAGPSLPVSSFHYSAIANDLYVASAALDDMVFCANVGTPTNTNILFQPSFTGTPTWNLGEVADVAAIFYGGSAGIFLNRSLGAGGGVAPSTLVCHPRVLEADANGTLVGQPLSPWADGLMAGGFDPAWSAYPVDTSPADTGIHAWASGPDYDPPVQTEAISEPMRAQVSGTSFYYMFQVHFQAASSILNSVGNLHFEFQDAFDSRYFANGDGSTATWCALAAPPADLSTACSPGAQLANAPTGSTCSGSPTSGLLQCQIPLSPLLPSYTAYIVVARTLSGTTPVSIPIVAAAAFSDPLPGGAPSTSMIETYLGDNVVYGYYTPN